MLSEAEGRVEAQKYDPLRLHPSIFRRPLLHRLHDTILIVDSKSIKMVQAVNLQNHSVPRKFSITKLSLISLPLSNAKPNLTRLLLFGVGFDNPEIFIGLHFVE